MTSISLQPLLTVSISRETDFLLARRRAREIAARLAMDTQDQTRIATAVSEIARNAFIYAGGGKVEFFLNYEPRPALRVVIEDHGPGISNLPEILRGHYRSQSGMGLGMLGARRLSDDFQVESSSSGTRVTLIKLVPPAAAKNIPPIPKLIKALSQQKGTDAVSMLVDQNQELLQLVEQVQAREAELDRLNRELEETNRGVLALYSELEDKAESVQQAAEMKSRFLSGVTHELRTPLNSIVSLARLLMNRVDGELNPEQEKQVGFILRSAQNLTEMVNDLLDLAKIEAGKIVVRAAPAKINDVFGALRGMFRPLAMNEKVELRLEDVDPSLEVITDEGKLAQILRNFISNALKFTEAGEVVVRAWQESGWIYFCVSDTGIGIAPEDRELVLQEWTQVEDRGVNSRHKGSGLGLPLSKKLAHLLGGEMWFDSELGKGSQFYIRLPLGKERDEDSAPPSTAIEVLLQPSILIVDDDEVSRYLLRRRLAVLTTARVREAQNGMEALTAIRAEPPALIVLDITMPEMSGMELAQVLRQDSATRHIPLLILTAKVLSAHELQVFEELEIEVVSKKQSSSEEHHIHLERALLQVGLSNLHERR